MNDDWSVVIDFVANWFVGVLKRGAGCCLGMYVCVWYSYHEWEEYKSTRVHFVLFLYLSCG